MHRRGWGKVVDPHYGGPIYIPPNQHALPRSQFVDLEAEAQVKRELTRPFEEAVERAVERALARARLTIGGNGK